MGKYADLLADVFSVFASEQWRSEEIETVPANYPGHNSEFIRLNVIPSGDGLTLRSTSGVLMIDIFTAAGRGPSRLSAIADKLDELIRGKSFKSGYGTTQFLNSSVDLKGLDRDNPALYRGVYQIQFNHFGV